MSAKNLNNEYILAQIPTTRRDSPCTSKNEIGGHTVHCNKQGNQHTEERQEGKSHSSLSMSAEHSDMSIYATVARNIKHSAMIDHQRNRSTSSSSGHEQECTELHTTKESVTIQNLSCLDGHYIDKFSNFGSNTQNFDNTNFEFNSNIFKILIPFIHSTVLKLDICTNI